MGESERAGVCAHIVGDLPFGLTHYGVQRKGRRGALEIVCERRKVGEASPKEKVGSDEVDEFIGKN